MPTGDSPMQPGPDPLPPLARIPKDRWRSVLAALSPPARRAAVNTVGSLEDVSLALRLVGQLEMEEPLPFAMRPEAGFAPTVPAPSTRPHRRRERQIGFRLAQEEYGDLVEAARLHGTTPTQLARIYAMRGARRALADERATRRRRGGPGEWASGA